MPTLYFKVAADYEEVQRLRTEIDNLKSSLQNINSQTPQQVVSDLETKLKSCVEQYRAITSEASKAGAMIENEFKKSIESLDLKGPTEQLKAFDSELIKMIDNLSGYFDTLQSKLQGMSDVLGGGKTIAGNISVNQDNVAQIEQMKQQNEELTSQIKQQQEEIQKQKQAWNDLANAVKTNNVSAIQQYTQSQSTSKEEIAKAREEIRGLGKDLDENIKYYDKLAQKAAEYAQYLSDLKAAKERGVERVTTGVNGTSMPIIGQIEEYEKKLQDVREDQKGISQEISAQRERYAELNATLETGSGKHVRIRTQIMEAREQLIQMQMAGQGNTAEFMRMAEHAGMLRRQMMLANATMNYYANPIRHLAGLKTAFQGAAGAASLLTGITGIFNAKSEKAAEIQAKVQSYLAIIIGLESTYSSIKKSSMAMQLINEMQIKAEVRARAMNIAAINGETGATVGLTIAQKVFNTVANMNPYLLLVTMAASIIGAIYMITKAVNYQSDAEKKAAEAAKFAREEYKKFAEEVASKAAEQIVAYKKLQKTWNELGDDMAAKKKFIIDNQSAFHNLGVSIDTVNQANNYLVKNSGNVVTALLNQAKAAAAFEVAKEYQKRIINRTLNFKNTVSEYVPVTTGSSMYGGQTVSYVKRSAKEIEEEKKRNKATLDVLNHNDENAMMNILNMGISNQKSTKKIYRDNHIKEYSGGSSTSGTNKATKTGKNTVNEAQIEQEERAYQASIEKQKYDREKLFAELKKEVSTSHIKAMKESSDKRIAQINADFENENTTLEQKLKEQEKKLKDDAESTFYKNPKRKKGTKYDETSDVDLQNSLSKLREKYEILKENASTEYNNKIDEQKQAEADSLNEYLQKYGNYEEKKLAITKLYQAKISKASTEGEKMTLDREMQDALYTLDFSELKKKMNWELIFGNIENASRKMLDKIREQLKAFINSEEFKKLSPTEQRTIVEGLQKTNDAIINKENVFKALSDSIKAYKKAKEELLAAIAVQSMINANPFSTQSAKDVAQTNVNNKQNNLAEADKKIDETVLRLSSLSKAIAKLGQSSHLSLSDIGNLTSTVMSAFGEAASKIGGYIGAALEVLDAVSKVGIEDLVKNIISSLSNAIGDIAATSWNIFTFGLFDLSGHADYTSYNEMKEKYQTLSSIWEDLISKKQKYLSESYGPEVFKAEEEIQSLLKNEIESYRTLGKERLNSGASTGSHSIGVRIKEGMDAEAWDQAKKALGSKYDESIYGGRMEGLFDLSYEQLQKLKEEAPLFWAGLDSDVRTYLDDIIKSGDAAEEALKKAKEQLLGISFDTVLGDFESMLDDMTSGWSDFTNNSEKMFEKMIIKSLLVGKYKKQLQDLYDSWYASANSDGKITTSEYEQLKKEWDDTMKKAVEERNVLKDTYGWTSTSSDKTSVGSSSSMSQDTGNAIEGRLTGIEEIEVERNSILTLGFADVKAAMTRGNSIVDENRTHLVNIYSELRGVHEDTSSMNKKFDNVIDKMNGWDNHVKKL